MERQYKKLVVIGAGIAGLGCGFGLSKPLSNLEIVLLEKSKKLGGRATSNSRQGFTYDHGANFFTLDGVSQQERMTDLIIHQLPSRELRTIDKPIATFDFQNVITPPKQEKQIVKYTYLTGILRLSQLLQSAGDLQVSYDSTVKNVDFDQSTQQWKVCYIDQKQKEKQLFCQYLLMTPPTPQSIEILSNSNYYKSAQLISVLKSVKYTNQLVFVVAFNKPLNLPYSALINEDKQHPIAWVSVENEKPGHVPDQSSLLIFQMNPQFSELNFNKQDEQLQEMLKPLISSLIPQIIEQSVLESIAFIWVKKWRYSLPATPALNEQDLQEFESDGLFVAGDMLLGKGRVLGALEKGLLVADRIIARL